MDNEGWNHTHWLTCFGVKREKWSFLTTERKKSFHCSLKCPQKCTYMRNFGCYRCDIWLFAPSTDVSLNRIHIKNTFVAAQSRSLTKWALCIFSMFISSYSCLCHDTKKKRARLFVLAASHSKIYEHDRHHRHQR